MSITAYTGLPGAGKSYSAVEHQILPALKAGRRLVTNIPLTDAVREEFPAAEVVEFPLEEVKAEPARILELVTPGTVFVLDEVWKLWPQGLKADKVPLPFAQLLAEHRHMQDAAGNSVVIALVVQDLANIATFARSLVERTFRITKLSAVGLDKRFRVDVYEGPMSGPNPPQSKRQREMHGSYSEKVYRFYRSHTLAEGDGSKINEKPMDRRGVFWKSPLWYIGAPVTLAGVVVAIWTALRFFHGETLPQGPSGARPSGNVEQLRVPVGAVQPGRRADIVGAAPITWRVAGTIRAVGAGQSRAILTDGRVSVSVDFETFCARVLQGWTECQWQGQTVTEWSAAPAVVEHDAIEQPQAAEASALRAGA